MIDQTFIHCPGIGPKTDKILKQKGFNNWNDCLNNIDGIPFTGKKLNSFIEKLNESKSALSDNNIKYFVNCYPHREHWRILGYYFDKCTFFDIETTGLSKYYNHATVITAFKDGAIHTFFADENLDDFLNLVDNSSLLVSFNGNAFDIPFLESTFHIPDFNCPHVDLRWVSYHAGYKSGLKDIEKKFNLKRPNGLEHIDGFEAVRLYYDYISGNLNAKNKLINYCKTDTVSSLIIAGKILNQNGFNIGIDENYLFGLIN